jgi:8-oxo-dGTP pyrophosphatase MutT (NUDIX family)
MSKRYNFNKKPPVVKNSYGIACCRYNLRDKRMEILMVKKRYTFYFVEFIMGHYSPTDDTKLVYLFNRIANEEKVDIESMDFDLMWYRVWRGIPKQDTSEYTWFLKCKRKFEANFSNNATRLKYLLSQSTSSDPMWEIPKGKRNPDEKELTCALREFHEETGVDPTTCKLTHDEMEMRYTNNKATYVNKYFLALDTTQQSRLDTRYKIRTSRPKLGFTDARQISEIIDVRWMSLVEIRFLDQTKRFTKIIDSMFKLIRSRYKVPKLTESDLL